MIATWMVYALLVGMLVASAARGLEEFVRALGLPARFVWLGALLALLVLTALAPLRAVTPSTPSGADRAELSPLVEAEEGPAELALPSDGAPGGVAAALSAVREGVQQPLRAAGELAGERAGAVLGAAWLTLSLLFLLLGAATLLRARASLRSWPRALVAGTPVRVAPGQGPAVLGLFRPEIVVPDWLLGAPDEAQTLIVAHEREHLRARDPLTLAAGCAVLVLLPWNVAAWWMLRRLRLAVEMDCDARVLRDGARPHAYGTLLIETAGRGPALLPGAPALIGSTSHLERRLRAMHTPSARTTHMRATVAGALGLAALLTACETSMPTAAEVQALDVVAAEHHPALARLLRADRERVFYDLDGQEVSAEEARAVPADRIAQLEVVRATDGQRGRIRLTTEAMAAVEANEMVIQGSDGGAERRRELVSLRAADADTVRAPGVMEARGGNRVALVHTDGFPGLVFIDGRVASPAEVRTLHVDAIAGVEVLKGAAAARFHPDPRAAHGVIRITTGGAARD